MEAVEETKEVKESARRGSIRRNSQKRDSQKRSSIKRDNLTGEKQRSGSIANVGYEAKYPVSESQCRRETGLAGGGEVKRARVGGGRRRRLSFASLFALLSVSYVGRGKFVYTT